MSNYLSHASTYLVSYGLNLLAAILIFAVGKWLAGFMARLAERALLQSRVEKTLASFLRHLAYIALMIVVITAALSQLGVQTTSFVAVLGAAALAVGLALQGSLANFAAGVLMVLFRPFKVGDVVESAGVTGEVVEVQLFTTVLNTPDCRRVIVPNAQMTSGVITNFTANPLRRIDLVIGVSYEADLSAVKRILEEIVTADPAVLKDPAPEVGVLELADGKVQLALRPWVHGADYGAASFRLLEQVKLAFDAHGIHHASPQQVLQLKPIVLQSEVAQN
ncbi:MAG: mechanosensitive ion channel family protein [Candidatus Xenobia bacterium]